MSTRQKLIALAILTGLLLGAWVVYHDMTRPVPVPHDMERMDDGKQRIDRD